MTVKTTKKILAAMLVAIMFVGFVFTATPVKKVQAATTGTVINVNRAVNVRTKPSINATVVTTLALGGTATILETVSADSSDTSGYATWYKISFTKAGKTYQGYVATYFIKILPSNQISDDEFEKSIAEFPESYRPYLRQLHEEHPAWTFTAVNTNVDWNEAIKLESKLGVSLIENTVDRSWKSTASGAYNKSTGQFILFDSPNWVNASPEIIAYYMDPRNSLTSSGVFQFLNLSYTDDSIDTEAIEHVIANTFMASNRNKAKDLDGTMKTYAEIFLEAGTESKVNPVYLATKAVQECGTGGNTSSNGATGYYNFFNIGAYSDVYNASMVGLRFAQNGTGNSIFNSMYLIPWNSQGRSIVGGAKWISDYYVNVGQGTMYFLRFNFNPSSKYTKGYHQYMTAIQSSTIEANRIQSAFIKAGISESNLNFQIPVFLNMPTSPTPLPTTSAITDQVIKTSYNVILKRDPSQTELNEKTNMLKSSSPVKMVEQLIFSGEFLNGNLTDDTFLKTTYMALTGMDLTSTLQQQYQTLLNEGKSRKYVFSQIANTTYTHEYFNIYGLESGVYVLDQKAEDKYQTQIAFLNIIYNRCLGRDIDRSGMETWTWALNSGMSGPQVAGNIFTSTEYLNKNISNEEYINQLYSSCLGRTPDSSGFDTWMKELQNNKSRNYILADFLNSPEFKSFCTKYSISTTNYVATGPKYVLTPDEEKIKAFVTDLYVNTLDREPEEAGFNNWVLHLSQYGLSGEEAAQGFIFSDELKAKNLDNKGFVEVLYKTLLGRESDEGGLTNWTNQLDGGYSKEDVFMYFVRSDEYINKCILAGIKPYKDFEL